MTNKTTSILAVSALVLTMTGTAHALDLNVGVNVSGSASSNSESTSSGGSASGSTSLTTGVSAGGSTRSSSGGLLDFFFGGSDQDEQMRADTSVSGEIISGTSLGSGERGAVDATYSVDAVVELIENSRWTENSFAMMAALEAAAYDLTGQLDADAGAALNAAVDAHANEILNLQTSLAANAQLSAWLDAEGMQAGDVIAVGTTADGSLAVFAASDFSD